MNTVEKLLKMDAGKLKMPEKDVKIRLAKLNTEFEFPCIAINPDKYSEIQESSYEIKKGDIKKIDTHKLKIMTIIEGCPSIFKSKEVIEHFGCTTPKDLVNKLMLSGEQDDLYAEINKLMGYEDDEEEDIKN